MLPKIKIWIARESVEFLGFWPLSVEFDQFVTLLSVEFKKTLHFYLWSFFCVTSFSVEFFLRYIFFCGVFFALHVFLWSFLCVTCFSVEFFVRYMFFCGVQKMRYMFFCRVFVRYMFFCGVQKMRYMFFCRVFFALHVFLWSFFALHVFLSSFEFSSKIFYKLLNYSEASKIFCTSKLFHFF